MAIARAVRPLWRQQPAYWQRPSKTAQDSCSLHVFPADQTDERIEDVAPAEGSVCYARSLEPGRGTRLALTGGSSTVFGVAGAVQDGRFHSFTSGPGGYEIHVYQRPGARTDQEFVLTLPAGIQFLLQDGTDSEFGRLGDRDDLPVYIEIAAGNEPPQAVDAVLTAVSGGGSCRTQVPLPYSFALAFGHGNLMTISAADGTPITLFFLAGTGIARDIMRQVCRS